MKPTSSILGNETPLTPPKANPFTPVAIGLINAHVQDKVIIISTSKAGKFKVLAIGNDITKKLS